LLTSGFNFRIGQFTENPAVDAKRAREKGLSMSVA
jgi:hypothetical protein